MTEVEAAFPEASKKDKFSSVWSDRNVGLWSRGGLSSGLSEGRPFLRHLILYLN